MQPSFVYVSRAPERRKKNKAPHLWVSVVAAPHKTRIGTISWICVASVRENE